MASSPAGACFSSLPPELRIKIFYFALRSKRRIHPDLTVKRRFQKDLIGRLLQVNKTFNAEAAPVLYSENEFHFNDLYDAWSFLIRIGKTNCDHVRELHIHEFSFGCQWEEHGDLEHKATYDIPQSCANLAKLTAKMFARKTDLEKLKEYKDLIARFPRLSYVYYAQYDLVLLAEPMQDKDR